MESKQPLASKLGRIALQQKATPKHPEHKSSDHKKSTHKKTAAKDTGHKKPAHKQHPKKYPVNPLVLAAAAFTVVMAAWFAFFNGDETIVASVHPPSLAVGRLPFSGPPELSKRFTAETTYVERTEKQTSGPSWDRCHPNNKTIPRNFTTSLQVFKDDDVQAWFQPSTPVFKYTISNYAKYSEAAIFDYDNLLLEHNWKANLTQMSSVADLVDANGKALRPADIKPIDQDGVPTLRYKWKFRKSSAPQNYHCFAGERSYAIQTINAETRKETGYSLYLDAPSGQGLVYTLKTEYLYGRGPFKSFEPSFSKAGWNKRAAEKNTVGIIRQNESASSLQ